MLDTVKRIIKELQAVLDKNEIAYTVDEAGVDVLVNHNGNKISYSGYELALYEEAAKQLDKNNKLIFTVNESGLLITSDAKFDIKSFIEKINTSKTPLINEIVAVLITEKLTNDSLFDYCLVTVSKHGAWSRYDLTLAELTYAACFDLVPEPSEQGVYLFTELLKKSSDFFDSVES